MLTEILFSLCKNQFRNDHKSKPQEISMVLAHILKANSMLTIKRTNKIKLYTIHDNESLALLF
jgi:hypothetical protein